MQIYALEKKLLYHKYSLISAFVCLVFSGCSLGAPIVSPSRNDNGIIINSPSMHSATMRPYKVNGKTYYPTVVNVGDIASGIASWYGPDFHGKKTSNGEIYDMHGLTAAHKTLPMNTVVKVTNLNNSKEVIVRINDRGPFVQDRIIDLSKSAANKINLIGTGTAPVKVQVIGFNGAINSTSTPTPVTYAGGTFMVQIGAFRNIDGARIYEKNYHGSDGYKTVVKTYRLDNKPIHRVFLTGFRSEDEARDYAQSGKIDGAFIVRE